MLDRLRLLLLSDLRIPVSSGRGVCQHYTEFLKWSFGDRQSKAALLRNLAAARTDANQELIDRKIAYYATLYKLTEKQLTDRIRLADEQNISVAKLHQTLAAEAGLDPKQVRSYSSD